MFSVSNCWQHLISETKKQSKEHAILADIYNTHVTTRLSYVGDDLQRIYKQVINETYDSEPTGYVNANTYYIAASCGVEPRHFG